MQEFDLFVIGAGSGGVRCARIAAQNGARVAIAERRHWGGTCVNLGCVPKKLMVYAADYGREIDDARSYGWDVTRGFHDWAKLIDAKDREIERLNGIYISMLQKAGVTLFTGDARLVDSDTIEIAPSDLAPEVQTQTVRAKNIVIATGSTPHRLDIEGAEHAIVSDDAFHLEDRPERVAVIGSGYIGVEFAGIFAGLGSSVDLVYRQNLPLRGFDHELRAHLAELLPINGIRARHSTSPERIEKVEDGYRLHLDDGVVLETDCVFMATGRRPNIASLGLDRIGLKTVDGRIAVNAKSETNIPNVYAIGDVIDTYNLTPTAIAEGHILAERLFGEPGREWSFDTTPKAVFFTQPLASVGLTEEEATRDHDLEIFTSTFTPMRQTLSDRKGKVLMKLVVDAHSNVVLGAHMIGPDSPEIIQGLAIAVTAGLKKRDFDRTIGLHPTSAEEFVTMRSRTRYVPSASGTV
ncbi:glutathione-disulfide reductase [Gluconobacter wancherniae]|uniref:Glutathione reductase n=1 Tax=Gluconobacter wancherniae NBRC 103581 TaxID=656744 RepID=A0A511AWQ4_9PROT|nr:glutathione-disulfide reductase [Gluconobacter wancherniae]MBF0852823.1 glutathione-disulfide reductase [Gluconobacter wancherniae]GBD56461.1 glutathione reductase [Gluconobacter wancherniae NBRC 103581]GBR63912.1 glutathione reductase [Gluconobacter wancherniae NBRC 103581]GEK92638.1 glutathione reductase [Gluconobacter wancherniae NBRC 103581]